MPLRREPLISGVEWADEHFYLPEGSSQRSGRWKTQPLQIAPLNMMCNDAIREVDWQKSARVGYTKLMVAANWYLSVRRKRNGLIYQPTEDDAKDFTIDELESVVPEMSVIQAAFPAWRTSNERNTVKKKAGTSFTLDIRGAMTPKNFRRMTKQFVIGDEIDAWPLNVGREGDPILLALKRLSGAPYPKAIFGTTPTIRGLSHIERRMASADAVFRFHVPCPCCGHLQTLKWGGSDCDFGIEWDRSVPSKNLTSKDVWYRCEHSACGEKFHYSDLLSISEQGVWIADDSGIQTRDGINFLDRNGMPCSTPRHVGLHINALYSLTLTDGWHGLVAEWRAAKGDPLKTQVFINTVLGELWDDDVSEKLEWEHLFTKREAYFAPVPKRGLYLTAFFDTQDDRLEAVVCAWGRRDEMYVVDYQVFSGNTLLPDVWQRAEKYIRSSSWRHEGTGLKLPIRRFGIDAGGHRNQQVREFVKRFKETFAVACRGSSSYGQPVIKMSDRKDDMGTKTCWIGTDTAKDIVYGRYMVRPDRNSEGYLPGPDEPVPGQIHLPIARWCNQSFCQQAVAEVKRLVYVKGKPVYRYETRTAGMRNEVTDCLVGNLAMYTVAQQLYQLDLDSVWQSAQQVTGSAVKAAKTKKRKNITGGIA